MLQLSTLFGPACSKATEPITEAAQENSTSTKSRKQRHTISTVKYSTLNTQIPHT
jgi:hypothetical protein